MARSSPWRGALAAILFLFMTACGGGSSDGGDDGSSTDPDASTLSIEDTTVPANATQAEFSVSLSDPNEQHVSVDYETVDRTAVAGTDYRYATGTLDFAPGDTSHQITVEVLRTDFEAALQFAVELSGGVNATLHDAEGVATVTATVMLQEDEFDPNWADIGVFSPASSCASCHEVSEDAPDVMTYGGEDVDPYTGWRPDVMANGLADPYFQAAIIEEARTNPALAGEIEDSCLTCHAPMGRTHAHHTGTGLDSDGHYRLETALDQMHAREAVSCAACHQIDDDGSLGERDSFNGQYFISVSSRLIFGPYMAPVTQPMLNNTQYTPDYRVHTESSALCATCHTLFTPTIDVDTDDPTGAVFPEQTVYLEWQNSIYVTGGSAEAQCQDCHMPVPEDGYATQIATRPDGSPGPSGWPERTPFNTHALAGGNTHLLTLLKQYRDVLGLDAATDYDAKIAETRNLLGTRTAEIAIDAITQDGSIIEIPVRVTNLAGHKLPASYPSRRAWIHLRVVDADGQTVFESGRADPDGRLSIDADHLANECLQIEKDPAEFDYGRCYEVHRDLIDSPSEVAVYESIMGDVNGHITYVLLHAASYLKDNRLPPRGFARSEIPPEDWTNIYGLAASDPDFSTETNGSGDGQDTVHYRVDVAGRPAPFTIEARMLYQSVKPGFVYSLHADDDPRVSRYKRMYEEEPPLPETLASTSTTY